MFNHDEIPHINEPHPYELKWHEMEWEEFANATNRIMIYTALDGEPRIRFDHLGDDSYANFVAIVSQPHNKKFQEFLKLGLEGVRLVQVEKKKSFQQAIKVEEVLKKAQPREAEIKNFFTRRVTHVAKEQVPEPIKRRYMIEPKQKKTSTDESEKQASLDFDEPPF
jgi:hypothetical protein